MGGGDAISVQEVRRKTHRGRKEEGDETVRTGLVRVVGADSLSVSESPKRCPLAHSRAKFVPLLNCTRERISSGGGRGLQNH